MPSEDNQFINRPKFSEHEMEQKLTEIRSNVSAKLNKWADRVQVSMHFVPNIPRLEGERWTEDGKQYIMKGGVKQSVSLLQDARMPWWCPRCSKPMNHRFDRKFYYLRNWCFDCNVEVEGQMRIDGTYEAFERRLCRENEKAFLRDKIQQHLDYIRTFKLPQVHFSDGRWEQLGSIDIFEAKFAELEKDIEFCQARIEAIQLEEQEEADECAKGR
jgi:hypothetical protein